MPSFFGKDMPGAKEETMDTKVFLSHASEDKERFVIGFATRLREKGVDVWLDKWEMYPGDSLVDKIFEEGLKNAQAVIIVLSRNSINKRWVREELNTGLIKRINDNSKLIPVVIDDCEVPYSLRSTVWQKISNLDSYDSELDRIIMSIYGQTEKPPLGPPPRVVRTIIDTISGLTRIDTLVLKVICEKVIASGSTIVDTDPIRQAVDSLDIPDVEFVESLEILDHKGYLHLTRTLGGGFPLLAVTTYGFEQYARTFIPNYGAIFESVSFQLVNNGHTGNAQIADALEQPQAIVDHVLDVLASRGLIQLIKALGGQIFVLSVTPELRRTLKR